MSPEYIVQTAPAPSPSACLLAVKIMTLSRKHEALLASKPQSWSRQVPHICPQSANVGFESTHNRRIKELSDPNPPPSIDNHARRIRIGIAIWVNAILALVSRSAPFVEPIRSWRVLLLIGSGNSR